MSRSEWLDLLRIWPVIAALAGLVSLFAFLWLKSKFVTKDEFNAFSGDTKRDIKDVDCRVEAVENIALGNDKRIALLEDHVTSSPTRQEMQADISRLAAQISGMEAMIKGVAQQLQTTNQYMHTIIDRGLGQK